MKKTDTTQRRFAVFDIDGTLVRWQLYHAVAEALAKRGYLDQKAHQAIRIARMQWKTRTQEESFKAYERRLVDAYEKLLTTLTSEQLAEATEAVFEEYKDQVYTHTRELIDTLKQQNYLLFAVSGSQIEIVSKIAKHWGFDDCIGSVYEQKDGCFTGKVISHIGKKHLVIERLVAKHGATYSGSLAVGDSEGDITMLEAVENPIAFNPTKKLFVHARDMSWKVVIERKNMVYELEKFDNKYVLS